MRLHLCSAPPTASTGHGYDVFQKPRNLAEKLERAAFVVGPCEYTAGHLRGLVPPSGAATKVHVVVMGVDGERFPASTAYPGDATVVAIGRLVEKKGFAYLVEAAGELVAPWRARSPRDRRRRAAADELAGARSAA